VIDLNHDQLLFSFPEVHPDAKMTIEFQRTLRIPDGEREFPLLPGLGRFPLFPVRDLVEGGAAPWLDKVEAMLPMYQSEAMWLSFRPSYSVAHEAFYPFAIKIRTGQKDAVSGRQWSTALHRHPQDYLVLQEQSWLGGFSNGHGLVHQFVAVPFGNKEIEGLETPDLDNKGQVQIEVYPLARRAFDLYHPTDSWKRHLNATRSRQGGNGSIEHGAQAELEPQKLNRNSFRHEDWDREARSTYSIHLANSLQWCAMTGSPPPSPPLSARLATHLEKEQDSHIHLSQQPWRTLKPRTKTPVG
jgi:hypothetical protein